MLCGMVRIDSSSGPKRITKRRTCMYVEIVWKQSCCWRNGMSTLTKPETLPEPIAVQVTEDTLSVDLADGRTIAVPIAWFPRLRNGSQLERNNFELGRNGVHWPDLDEDIPVAGLLNGEKSGESLASIQRWMDGRPK
jgi:hypothetical protein